MIFWLLQGVLVGINVVLAVWIWPHPLTALPVAVAGVIVALCATRSTRIGALADLEARLVALEQKRGGAKGTTS